MCVCVCVRVCVWKRGTELHTRPKCGVECSGMYVDSCNAVCKRLPLFNPLTQSLNSLSVSLCLFIYLLLMSEGVRPVHLFTENSHMQLEWLHQPYPSLHLPILPLSIPSIPPTLQPSSPSNLPALCWCHFLHLIKLSIKCHTSVKLCLPRWKSNVRFFNRLPSRGWLCLVSRPDLGSRR